MNPELIMTDLVRTHQLAAEDLTERQLVDTLVKMLPDIRRYVSPCGTKQSVVYLPGLENDRLRERIRKMEAVLREIRAGYGGQKVDPGCGCADCEFLTKLDAALEP